jgi:DNA-binding LacI/PurR family transcriptional regulator
VWPRASGILAMSDQLAWGLIPGLAELGCRVPDDIAVIGWDGNPGLHAGPPLTTIRQDLREQGRVAAELALRGEDGEGRKELSRELRKASTIPG